MNSTYSFINNLVQELPDIPENSIISKTIHSDDNLKVILFGFAEGQELSEHTAAVPALIHILEGEALIVLDEDAQEAKTGTWIFLPANLSHSVYANTSTIMLLTLLKQ